MSIRNSLLLAALLAASPTFADGISNSLSPQPHGNLGFGFDGGVSKRTGGGGVPLGSCPASTAYLTAQTGLSGTESHAYDTAVCALSSGGFICNTGAPCIDGLYFFANANAANARVNVVSPGTHNLTEHGTCTLTVDRGITGDGVAGVGTCYEDPGFIPSTAGGNMTVNSGALGFCILNARVSGTGSPATIGSTNATANYFYTSVYAPGGTTEGTINANAAAGFPTVASSQGATFLTAVNSSLQDFWINGAQTTLARNNATLVNVGIVIMAFNNNGVISNFSSDQVAWVLFGSGLTGAQIATIRGIMSTMTNALGAPNVC